MRGEALWAHVKLINPTDALIKGYWWTNVQMPITTSTSKAPETVGDVRCKPKDPTLARLTRHLSSVGCLAYSEPAYALVPWPKFKEKCCQYSQSMPGSFGKSKGPIDMSWLSNYTIDNDVFLQVLGWNRTSSNFIALADKDLWGEQHGVIHGHSTPFNKVWTMGQDEAHGWSETGAVWHGCFAELQIGIAPTQMHTFDLPPHSSHEHSEYFLTMDGLKSPDRLYSDDYADAIDEISNYLNSSPHGVDHAAWAEMQASMKAVAEQSISTPDILFNGSAWGAFTRS